MTAGSLSANYVYMGGNGTGAFLQSGGATSIASSLYLGYNAADTAHYTLSGTGSLTGWQYQYVGYSGTGSFAQLGGQNSLNTVPACCTSVTTAAAAGPIHSAAQGSWNRPGEYVGYSGWGSFTQTSSEQNNPSGILTPLTLGNNAGSSGTYNLNGGQMAFQVEYVGLSGSGS